MQLEASHPAFRQDGANPCSKAKLLPTGQQIGTGQPWVFTPFSRKVSMVMPGAGIFHLLKNIFVFPSWFLKGIYHYWIFFFFPGALTKWKGLIVSTLDLIALTKPL